VSPIPPPEVMDAVVMTGPGALEVQRVAVPELRPGHALVRTSYVGLCGTDASLYDGSSVYLERGLKRYPFVFGHEWSGSVAAVADDVRGLTPGDRVAGHNFITCDTCVACRSGRRLVCPNRSEMGVLGDYPGAASQYVLVPAKVLARLPETVDDRTGALLEPSTTALHAVTRIGVRDDDHVAVLGTGTLGLVAIQLAKAAGARVDAIGVEADGLALAAELGADATLTPDQAPADRYTAVMEVSGAAAAAAQAPLILAFGGRLALVGVAHSPVPGFPAAQLVLKNANVQAVLSGIDQWDRLIGLVARGALRLDPLVDLVVPYQSPQAAFDALLRRDRKRPKIMIDFGSEAG
jgi:2-desacetyl-2-hydroxyethyl bacteriochlorophyllide A dehydrogenase